MLCLKHMQIWMDFDDQLIDTLHMKQVSLEILLNTSCKKNYVFESDFMLPCKQFYIGER